MPRVDDALRAWVLADAGVSALIGQRMYPDVLPQGAIFPAIRYFEVSLSPLYAHQGDLNLDTSRYQFDCYAATRPAARDLAAALRAALSGKKTYQDGVTFRSTQLVNSLSGYDDALNAWRMVQDYQLSYSVDQYRV